MAVANITKGRARWSGKGFKLGVGFAAGTTADTDITITGIKIGDVIISALVLQPPTASSGSAISADLVAECIITAANTIQFTDTSTANNQVLIIWQTVNF